MEMTAGLWENNWVLPSRISCNQFSHRLEEGRKSLTKDSHAPHDITASNFIAVETQVPGCFWTIRADRSTYSRMWEGLLLDSTLWFGRSVTDSSETTVEPFARSMNSHQTSGHTQAAVGTVPFLAEISNHWQPHSDRPGNALYHRVGGQPAKGESGPSLFIS